MNYRKVRTTLQEVQDNVHATAVDRGWWKDHDNLKKLLEDHGADYDLDESLADTLFILARTMLVVTELSEGIEAYRDGDRADDKIPSFSGLTVELADARIRLHDMEARFDLNVTDAMIEKMEYNKGREYLHGGKKV